MYHIVRYSYSSALLSNTVSSTVQYEYRYYRGGGCAVYRILKYYSTTQLQSQRRQKQIWKEYRDKMRQKDREHFGIQEGGKGPLESIFSQSDFQGPILSFVMQLHFQGLAVGTYGEISSNDQCPEDGQHRR